MENNNSEQLKQMLSKFNRLGVFFSGGVDSAALLKLLHDAFGAEKVLALFAILETAEGWEENEAKRIAENLGIELVSIHVNVLELPEVASNSELRCYHCKKLILSRLMEVGKLLGADVFVDGSTYADKSKVRPGSLAITELGVISPLVELRLERRELREIAVSAGCSTAVVSGSCMVTRFPQNHKITEFELSRIRFLEQRVRNRGYSFVRARVNRDEISLEVLPSEVEKARKDKKPIGIAKELGFQSLVVHLDGYTGEI